MVAIWFVPGRIAPMKATRTKDSVVAEKELLIAIRTGKYTQDQVFKLGDDLAHECQQLLETSDLPDSVLEITAIRAQGRKTGARRELCPRSEARSVDTEVV
jgi:hypothetical protein